MSKRNISQNNSWNKQWVPDREQSLKCRPLNRTVLFQKTVKDQTKELLT